MTATGRSRDRVEDGCDEGRRRHYDSEVGHVGELQRDKFGLKYEVFTINCLSHGNIKSTFKTMNPFCIFYVQDLTKIDCVKKNTMQYIKVRVTIRISIDINHLIVNKTKIVS